MAGNARAGVVAASILAADRTTAEVVEAFQRADITRVLLKRRSLADWRCPGGPASTTRPRVRKELCTT
jgi:hypothetical protein